MVTEGTMEAIELIEELLGIEAITHMDKGIGAWSKSAKSGSAKVSRS